MLARMWRKGNSHKLLVGMQNGIAAVENNMEASQKFKSRITIWPNNSTPRYYMPPQKMKVLIWKDAYTSMFITTLFTSLKLRKQHQVSINRSMDKEDVVYEVPHLAIKKKTKKQNLAICNNMDGLGDYYVKWNKSGKINTEWYHLYVDYLR